MILLHCLKNVLHIDILECFIENIFKYIRRLITYTYSHYISNLKNKMLNYFLCLVLYMETTIHTNKSFNENMLQSTVQDILSFWNIELKQTINIMDTQHISKKIKKQIKKKFNSCYQYLAKKNILYYVDINVDTYYAIIILFTLYTRCMYKDSKKLYINYEKIYMYMEIGLQKHTIRLDHLHDTINNTYAILLPFQITENYLQHIQGRELMYRILFNNKCIIVKNILRKIIYFQKKRIMLLDMFQRFPNRNKILKRRSTIEEIDFLDELECDELKLIF